MILGIFNYHHIFLHFPHYFKVWQRLFSLAEIAWVGQRGFANLSVISGCWFGRVFIVTE